jgi:penicillin-binding protein 2
MRNTGTLPKNKHRHKYSKLQVRPIVPTEKQKQNERTIGQHRQSVFIMSLVSLVLVGGVGSRLAYLQLYEGASNRERAENNRVRILPKQPVRGNLFDRKGRVLATARLTHALYLWPRVQHQPDWPENLQRLSDILGIPAAEIQKRIEQTDDNGSTLVRIARSLTPAQITALEEYRDQINGIEVDIETLRHYPNGKTGAHVLGYTGELNPAELKARKPLGYRLGDVAGKMGVEDAYEQQLRGEWGGIQLEVNGQGKVMEILGQKVAKPGNDVTLSIDLDLQKTAEETLGKRKGAVVAMDPNTGEVLAMVSYPSFDPNVFSTPITTKIWRELQGEGNPFINRSLQGFPPASTFKVVTATAGLESGKYPPKTILGTYAYLNVGGTLFGEWNRAGFGPMGYVRAMAMSSNTFHGQIGRGAGGPALIKWARSYGFGQRSGIELAEETPGLIVDAEWKRKNFNWDWTDGDTVNMSIGQGFTLATPLQVARMFSVAANGGYLVKPHLTKDAADSQKWRKSLNLKPETIKTIRSGLRAVVAEGTARRLDVPYLPPIAGKSGTAEAPPGKSHTWFGGFAPFEKPQIAVLAFVEHSGGGGGSVAAPIVLQVLETYFKAGPRYEKQEDGKTPTPPKKPPVNRN